MQTDASERKNSRTETIDRIRVALKRRTGRAWSVRGGRGTGYSWIEIAAPSSRRGEFGRISEEDAAELSRIFDLPASYFRHGGYSFPFNEREYMIARAEGLNVEDLARPMAANDNDDALASLG